MTSSSCRLWVLLPGLALAGCGGGTSPNPTNSGPVTIFNAISRADFRDSSNNRYYDIYVCDPTVSGDANVEMHSPDLDSSLIIYRKDSSGDFEVIAEDDDGGGQGDAFVSFSVERGGSYRIVATSAQAEERGNYEVRFSEELGRPALVLPKVNPQTQSLVLPPAAKKK